MPCDNKLISYGGTNIRIMGNIEVSMIYDNDSCRISVYVVDSISCCNIGFDAICQLKIDLNSLIHTKSVNGIVLKLSMCRSTRYALYDTVKEELNRQVEKDFLTLIHHSGWAFSIVVVQKPNRLVRIPSDFRNGLNSQINDEQYPLPKIDDLLLKLKDTGVLSKRDMQDTYLQVELDEEAHNLKYDLQSQKLCRFSRRDHYIGIFSSVPHVNIRCCTVYSMENGLSYTAEE
ncbi:hypothetical protein RF11_13340 [Thelohanellus kitauei]|uniref:Reverse transcriptase domain-containing protein n=1 Tax=Thelohanellus kitauei TaxID=669202 RepID=A0A0C2MG16_THEKT|nr:hypothetical protein RF11_13340 [Thelohanellus kitauei]